jgi:hypothetical protein
LKKETMLKRFRNSIRFSRRQSISFRKSITAAFWKNNGFENSYNGNGIVPTTPTNRNSLKEHDDTTSLALSDTNDDISELEEDEADCK